MTENNKRLVLIFFSFLVFYGIYKISLSFLHSYFLKPPDRINLLIYHQNPQIISIGVSDNIHYLLNFDSNTYINVPGGLGNYKVGSVGKLAGLKNDDNIISRAFAKTIGTPIDGYLIPRKLQVYSSNSANNPDLDKLPTIKNLLLLFKNKTNLKFLNRIYIALRIIKLKQTELILLKIPYNLNKNGTWSIAEKKFSRNYAGFFYQANLRQERANVKIVYLKYSSAVNINRILEGQGIRVVDLEYSKSINKNCLVVLNKTDSGKFKKTVDYLNTAFDCSIKYQDTRGVDIIIQLGDNIENSWQ